MCLLCQHWGGQWQRRIDFDCWNHFSTLLFSISSVVNTVWWWLIWNENIFTLRMHFHMSIYISLTQSFFYLILYFSLQSPDQAVKSFTIYECVYFNFRPLFPPHDVDTWIQYLKLCSVREFPTTTLSGPPLCEFVLWSLSFFFNQLS